jgi:hypothetical protein
MNNILLGTNESYWSWEYDTIIVYAQLYLNPDNSLLLTFNKRKIKSGLGKGDWNNLISRYDVGTINKPKKRYILSLLSKNKLTDSPFPRNGWYNKEKGKLNLSEILDMNNQPPLVSRTLKIKKIKELI